jgi:GDPmannose 4,6-dehydratase
LNWEEYVRIDEAYMRPAEVDTLLGDPTKAQTLLHWSPTAAFDDLVRLMVEADLRAEGIDPEEVLVRAPGGPAVASR